MLRSTETILKNEAEVVGFVQKDFGLDQRVAAESYKILKQVLTPDGDIKEPVLKSIIDKIRQEPAMAAEVRSERN